MAGELRMGEGQRIEGHRHMKSSFSRSGGVQMIKDRVSGGARHMGRRSRVMARSQGAVAGWFLSEAGVEME